MKYFIFLLLLLITKATTASYTFYQGPLKDVLYGSPQSACQALYTNQYKSFTANSNYPGTVDNQNVGYCVYGNYGSMGEYVIYKKDPIKCGKPGTPVHVSFNNMDHIPLTVCTKLDDGRFCVTEGNVNTVSGGGTYLGVTYNPSIIHSSISETPSLTCTPKFSDTKCDNKDPYGGCYVPPNDGCTRHADGSIYCPTNIPTPTPSDTCSGATYCKKPPLGCGTGYVSGSFNGEQLCVKSSPSTPTDPTQPEIPNACDAQYCPKPEPEKDCPTGYYSTYHNGSPICVANNPNPNQPNINDPNNNDDATSAPSGGDDPNTNFDVKGIIDAIKSLKDSLLQAFSNLGKKVTELIDGQKQTNEKLDQSNEKLDTSNQHLENLEKSSQAASESLGDIKEESKKTNEKLDSIKDSIDSQNKCPNESYDSNNPNSQKYRECTEQDLIQQGEDTKVTVQEKTINLDEELKRDLFGGNSTCPPPLVIEWTFIATTTLEFKYDLMCYAAALVRPWMILLGLIVSYFVITGHRSGSQD